MSRPEVLTAAAVLELLSQTPLKPAELVQRTGASRVTVHRRLQSLLDEELVVRVGSGPTAAYRLPTAAEQIQKSRSSAAAGGQVRLVLDRQAATDMQEAMELFTRIGIGQLEEIAGRASFGQLLKQDGKAVSVEELEELRDLTDALKHRLLNLGAGASFGIYNPAVHPLVRLNWTMQRALRHRMAWDRRPEGSMGVHHDEPLDGDSMPGLFVHSDSADASGVPTRYVLEMPALCIQALERALSAYIRLSVGDIGEVIKLAEEQVLRHFDDGGPVPAHKLEEGKMLVGAMCELLRGANDSGNVALSDAQARVLEVLNALQQFSRTGQPSCSGGATESGTRVEPMGDSPWAMTVDDLPAGMLLNFHAGKYRIIAAHEDGKSLSIVAESHSLKTAVQMAHNVDKRGKARSWNL